MTFSTVTFTKTKVDVTEAQETGLPRELFVFLGRLH